MRKLILAASLLMGLSGYGQFSISDGTPTEKPEFPVLEPYSSSLISIQPTWTPGKKFLKENPSFLKDGSYKLSSSKMYKNEPLGMQVYSSYPSRFVNINSGSFPATFAKSDKNLDFVNMVHFTFTMNTEAGNKLPLTKKKLLEDEVTAEVYDLGGYVRLYEDRFNNAVRQLVTKKSIPKFEVSPIPSSLYGEKEMSVNDLVLDFQCLGAWSRLEKEKFFFWAFVPPGGYLIPVLPNFWALWFAKHKGGASYPSLAIYQLNVRDVTGNIIQSYRQVIFIGEKHKYYKNRQTVLGNRTLLLQSMPVAMESLVNRFLNDEEALAMTRNYMNNLAQRQQANPSLLDLAKAQARINMYQRRKTSFVGLIEESRLNIKAMGEIAAGIPQSVASSQQFNNSIYNYSAQQQQLNSLGASAAGLVGNMIVRNQINKSTREAAVVEDLFRATVDNENRYVAEIAQLIESNEGLATMVSKSKSVNQFFIDEMKRVDQAKAESKQKTQAATQSLNQSFKQAFSKTLTDFVTRNNVPLAEMSAMSADGSGAAVKSKAEVEKSSRSNTAVDPCARQAQTALLNSAEYKKFMSEGGFYNYQMMEWKRGTLLLQHCGDKLPAHDREVIGRIAEQCRQTALKYRSETPKWNFKGQ